MLSELRESGRPRREVLEHKGMLVFLLQHPGCGCPGYPFFLRLWLNFCLQKEILVLHFSECDLIWNYVLERSNQDKIRSSDLAQSHLPLQITVHKCAVVQLQPKVLWEKAPGLEQSCLWGQQWMWANSTHVSLCPLSWRMSFVDLTFIV